MRSTPPCFPLSPDKNNGLLLLTNPYPLCGIHWMHGCKSFQWLFWVLLANTWAQESLLSSESTNGIKGKGGHAKTSCLLAPQVPSTQDPDTLTPMGRSKTMSMKLLVQVVNDSPKYVTKVSEKLFKNLYGARLTWNQLKQKDFGPSICTSCLTQIWQVCTLVLH